MTAPHHQITCIYKRPRSYYAPDNLPNLLECR